jgi:tryptophan-rich sensory protein
MDEKSQYLEYIQPSWAPPGWLFGPVWSVLYVLIAFSFGYVFIKAWQGSIPAIVVLPFVINVIANAAFTPVQFGLKNLPLASVVIVAVLGSLIWSMIAIWPYYKWVALMQIPYLLWVSFATVLQFTITYLNR